MNPLNRLLRTTTCVILIGAGLILGGPAAGLVIVDDFTQGPLPLVRGTNVIGQTIVQTGLNSAATLGGTRSVYVGSLGLASVSIDTIKSRFHFSADASFGYFRLDWGTLTPLNVDLTSGNDRFRIEFVDVTPVQAFSLFDLRIKSGGAWFSYDISNDFVAALHGQTSGVLNVPFTKFRGANLTQVQGIELEAARVPAGFRLSMDTFTVVPEPGMLALVGFAIIACGLAHHFGCKRNVSGRWQVW